MNNVSTIIGKVKTAVRSFMRRVAKALDKLSGGRLKPNTVTMASVFGHVFIAFVIGSRHFFVAGLLLIFFGLFDTLDGELARLQNRTSKVGMLLDSSMDRLKEILLYLGIAYSFVAIYRPGWAVWAVAACGASLLVSYMNAWGEVLVKERGRHENVNQTFRGGFMSFEVRMAVLVLALLLNKLDLALVVIAVGAWWTAMNRLMTITDKLDS